MGLGNGRPLQLGRPLCSTTGTSSQFLSEARLEKLSAVSRQRILVANNIHLVGGQEGLGLSPTGPHLATLPPYCSTLGPREVMDLGVFFV